MPRVGFAWTPSERKNFVVRGGYGLFYERTTGGFANSLRQAPPFFRELQLNNLGDWNVVPRDIPALPIPSFSIAFDDNEPILVGSNDPDNEFEALETQMVSPDLETPSMQQWSVNTQWEFRNNWLLEVGYIGSKGDNLLQFINQNQAFDIDAIGGFLPRAGVPGGGFTGNYYDPDEDEFVNLKTPPPSCDLLDDPGECIISPELRGPLLGLDEDEGANMLVSNGKSWYHALQTSLQKRFAQGYMFNVNYTFSRSIDYFSDEGLFQVPHDQTRPELNKGLSDFHRKHRLILSWAWDLPFRGNAVRRGLADRGDRHVPVGPAVHDHRRGFQRGARGHDRSAAGSRAGRDARRSDDERIDLVAHRQLPESRRVRQFRHEIRQPGPEYRHRPGSAARRSQHLEDDPADGESIAGVPGRGVQRDQHADLPQSRTGHRRREFRPDHADAWRPARDPARIEVQVLTLRIALHLDADGSPGAFRRRGLPSWILTARTRTRRSPRPRLLRLSQALEIEAEYGTAQLSNDPDDPAIWVHPRIPAEA